MINRSAEQSTNRPISVLCADDHPLVRKGIASILATEEDIQLVGEAGNGSLAVEAFFRLQPDVTLMDLRMPVLDGIAAAKRIMRENPTARIIALTSYHGDHEIWSALEAGVRGYILKDMVHDEVVRAIRIVHSGKRLMPPEVAERLNELKLNEHFPSSALTSREIEVLQCAAQGFGNKEIGDHLGMAANTAKMHLQNISSKLGASDRTHAVTLALRRGIIRLDS